MSKELQLGLQEMAFLHVQCQVGLMDFVEDSIEVSHMLLLFGGVDYDVIYVDI